MGRLYSRWTTESYPVYAHLSSGLNRMSDKTNNRPLPPPVFPRVIRDRVREGSVSRSGSEDLAGSSNDARVVHPANVREGAVNESELDDNDTDMLELLKALRKLADTLEREGERGLLPTPELSQLESMLRSYCQGYLIGRRMGDE